ncbi:MAG: ATP-binding domain-containing protein [Burkholderiales bacterium]|nr:ATP-binding domain-containing protein [Burkholderiales bacterium]
MATILPDGWRALPASGAAQRELQTLHALAQGLPDGYTVLHALHWTRVADGHQVVGEVDFVVIGPSGRVLLIEQKSGFLAEGESGLAKTYGERTKSVPAQMARTAAAIDGRLRQFCKGEKTPIESLLYCPDYTVRQPGTAGLPPERIVDAPRRAHLARIIQSILPVDEPAHPTRAQALKFFIGLIDLVPDVGAMAGQARVLYTRLSEGLATWARRIECTPHRLRVTATAGSGKTQLALALLDDARAAGRRALYVCYNRPLADHMAAIAAPGSEVATYHQLCDRAARADGVTPDYARAGAFRALEERFAARAPAPADCVDELIVDEGQDFEERWVAPLLARLRPGGRAFWLEDPMQNLYGRAPVALPGWVRLSAQVNYRTPRDILEAINRLVPLEQPVAAGSPLTGSEVEILTYADTAGLVRETTRAITNCIGAGFARDMIAVVTYRGREHSALTPYDRIGPYRLKAYTGRYDLFGNAVVGDGDIVIDSVHRFKGRSAPCVVFTEIDFAEGAPAADEAARRRLFVGATRATMKLVLVVSERAARVMLGAAAGSAA